ncbi:MAG: hypothetical protein MPN21_28115, partial [Thermoanaerobaculia bacterium]|nr:hypothetical protein [Thermoanaerobaculia bacterium]
TIGCLVALAEAEALLELGELEAAWQSTCRALEANSGAVLVVDLGTWVAQVRILRTRRRFIEAHDLLDRLDQLLRHVGLRRWRRQRSYNRAKVWSVQAMAGDQVARARWGAWVADDGCLDPRCRCPRSF